ncbi:flagellar biosynthesis anti-sigma factor FlgM [Candidatus Micrarchaeota archaeon]|nr:flagellar biosynthesis anti-sigma factor FlgM [Candidatus Micrarchaeota archaeon]
MAERPFRRLETRQEKLDRIKAEVKSGKYQIDPDKIADAILGLANRPVKMSAEKKPEAKISIEKDAMGRPHVLRREGLGIRVLGLEVNRDHPEAIAEYDDVTEKTHHYRPIPARQKQVLLRFLKRPPETKKENKDYSNPGK